MKTFTLEQIAQITGGMLTKAQDAAITKIAPPLLADENTLALALGEDEIANLSNTKAKAALVPLGVNIDGRCCCINGKNRSKCFFGGKCRYRRACDYWR